MNELKTWKVLTPAKGNFHILNIFLLVIILILQIKTQNFLFLLLFLIVLVVQLSPRPALFIKTSDDEVELSIGDLHEKIKWDEIVEYYQSDFYIMLKLSNGSSVSIDINSLEDREEFITYLKEKLKHLSQTECLNCGSLIEAEDNKCQSCGWTWEV